MIAPLPQSRAVAREDLSHGLKSRRDLRGLRQPLLTLTKNSPHLFHSPLTVFKHGGESYQIDKFSFIGPRQGGYLRLGLFGGVHGDETAGCHAVVE
ncbi:MAG: hypothetical protein LBD30_08875, partial [Verrucomicrobiales bacterium]|nr:hypothetical protein [Verrucomicrobiales bacterium]